MRANNIFFAVFVVRLTNGLAVGPDSLYALGTQHYLEGGRFSVIFMDLLPLYYLHILYTL